MDKLKSGRGGKRMSEEEKMLRKWIQNHKQLISEAPDEKQRDYITMM